MKPKSTKLFLIVSLIIALVDASLVFFNYRFSEQAFERSLHEEGEQQRVNFHTLLSQTYANMQTMATFIASDQQIQQLFLQAKKAVAMEGGGAGGELSGVIRQALYSEVGPNWKKVQNQFSARQLHFHLGPGSTSFLRVHRPEKFGDNMDNVRFTIVDTNKEQAPRTGFETGRVYSGLRGVVPVSALDPHTGKTEHVGALEVGTSFNVLLDILDENSNYGSGVMLTVEHIESAMWPEAIVKRFGENPGNACGCVIEASSREGFEGIISAGREQGIVYREGGSDLVTVDGSYYALSYFPLRDYLGSVKPERDDVGAVIFWRDANEQVAALKNSQLFNIIYGVVGFFIIELLFYIAFRFVTRRLEQTITVRTGQLSRVKERLLAAQQMASVGNWEWELKSGRLWWSDQIYRIFAIDKIKDETSYKAFLNRVHPDDRLLVSNGVDAALSGDKPFNVEHRLLLPEGVEKIVHAQGEVILDREGNPQRMVGTVQDISERKRAELELLNQQKVYRQMFEKNAAVKLLIDPLDGTILSVNKAAELFYGYDKDKFSGMKISQINVLPPEQVQQETLQAKQEKRLFFRFKHKLANGDIRDVEVYSGPVQREGRDCLYSIIFDVTDRNKYQRQLQQIARELDVERQHLHEIIWATNVGTWEWNLKTGGFAFNLRWAEMLGYSTDELFPTDAQMRDMLIEPGDLQRSKDQLQRVFSGELDHYEIELKMRHKSGSWVWVLVRGKVLEWDSEGEPLRMSGTHTDISLRKAREADIHRLATTDVLTGLSNRSVFNRRLNEVFALAKRQQQPFALLMLDLDGFKPVNDNYGHPVGDSLLKHVAWEMHALCRETDVVARLGGDEFAIIMTAMDQAGDEKALAERLLKQLNQEKTIEQHQIRIGVSIGICSFVPEIDDVEAMIRCADDALYQAKKQGKNTYVAAEQSTLD